MINKNAPIGIFDSGIGGLTVVKEVRALLPHEDIIYVGDTARVPYGSRATEEVKCFMHQTLRFFAKQKVKMVVFACNTMTACGFSEAASMYQFLLVPMNSAVKDAIEVSPTKKIGVIATQGTIMNQMHSRAAEKIDAEVEIYAMACPSFVPLIEGGKIRGNELEQVTSEYMNEFRGSGIDSLILGCTHYPLICDILQKYVGSQIHLINPAESTAMDAMNLLQSEQLLTAKESMGDLTMCFSADIEKAKQMTHLILNTDKAKFNLINLADY